MEFRPCNRANRLLTIRPALPLLVASVMALCAVRPAAAQVRVEVEPAFGVYNGLNSFTQPTPANPVNPGEAIAQGTALTFGVQATGWVGSGVGVRFLAFNAASEVGLSEANYFDVPDVPANVTILGLEALWPLRPFASQLRVFLAGGIGLVLRDGDAYDGFQGTSDLGGLVGIGSRYVLSDRLSLQGDLQLALYSLSLTGPTGLEYPSAFQADLLVTFGLAVTLTEGQEE